MRDVAMVVLTAMLLMVPSLLAADATLPRAPLVIDTMTLTTGREARIVLTPRAPASRAEPFDLYLARVPSGPPVLRYLGPDGQWSEAVTPYRRDLAPAALTPIAAAWREEGPPGPVSLLAVFTRRGVVPSNRQAWPYQPEFRRASVHAGRGAWTGAATVLGPLALATLVGLGLVLVLPGAAAVDRA